MSVPQISRITQTMIHGSSAIHIWLDVTGWIGFGAGMLAADSSLVRSAAESQSSFGCQTLRNRMRHAIDTSEAPMSTIQGLMKFEIRYCGTANETPVTRIAGQTPLTPFQPAKAQTTQNGTISEKNGNWRPTIAPSRNGSIPVTLAKPAIGVPSAP